MCQRRLRHDTDENEMKSGSYIKVKAKGKHGIIKRNRCNKQYSAMLTQWLDRLTHFDNAIQTIAGSALKS